MAQGTITFQASSITATSGASAYTMNGSASTVNTSTMSVASYDSWITPTLTFVTGEGGSTDSTFYVTLDVQVNSETSARTGTITVRGVNPTNGMTVHNEFTVEQSASGSEEQPITPTYKFEVSSTALTFSDSKGSAYDNWATENIDHVERGETSGDFFNAYIYPNASSVYVEVYENTGTTRTGYFYLNAIGINSSEVVKSVKVTVTQEGADTSAIITDTDDIYVDYNSHTGTVTAVYQNVTPSTISFIEMIGSNWCTITSSITDNIATVNYSMTTNVGDSYAEANQMRVGYIQFTGVGSDESSVIKMVSVRQMKSPAIYAFPIWKDTDITIASDNDYVYYRFYIDNKIAYSGKAYKIDDAIVVRANDILKDYCAGSLSFNGGCEQSEDGYIQAELYTSTDDWATSQIYCICRTWSNWSYTSDNVCSHPIEKEVDYRQYIVCSALAQKGTSGSTIEAVLPDGTTGATYSVYESLSNVVIKASDIVDYGKITLKHEGVNDTFNVVCTPRHKYVLYFRNIWGGYDWLLLNEASKRSDAISNLSFVRKIKNSTVNRATVQYQKTITEKVALKTHILTDKQAELVSKAMRSVDCYLHNLEDDTIYPVNITDTTINYTNYKNNGKKMFNYTINVEIAQNRFSR